LTLGVSYMHSRATPGHNLASNALQNPYLASMSTFLFKSVKRLVFCSFSKSLGTACEPVNACLRPLPYIIQGIVIVPGIAGYE